MGIIGILFNQQIMKCLGTDALAVYGIIAQITPFAQCLAYGAGQAAQPIISQNLGAGLEPSITALKGLCPDHLDEQTRFAGSCSLLRCPAGISPNEVGLSLADRGHSLSSLNLPPAALASLPLPQECVVTRISSISTLKSAARTIRLSTVGSAAPFCHL